MVNIGVIRSGSLRQSQFWMLGTLFSSAVLLNAFWELAQSPLFVSTSIGSFRSTMWHCFTAAILDGVLVLLINTIGVAVCDRGDWFRKPGIRGYAVMLLAGLIIGVGGEWFNLHMTGRWHYTAEMPLVFGLGVWPILQMLIIPAAVFRLVAWAGFAPGTMNR